MNKKLPQVNGARGVVLLGKGLLSFFFGIGYAMGDWIGIFAIWPPVNPGLYLLEEFLGGLRFWGFLWLVVGLYLIFAAFREDHSKAMAGFTFMCFIWAASYTQGFVMELGEVGTSRLWLGATAFFMMVVSSFGVARLINAPPLVTGASLDSQSKDLYDKEDEMGHDHGEE